MHVFTGFSGAAGSRSIGLSVWCFVHRLTSYEGYNFGPKGDHSAFEPILARYIRLAQFTIGLATGSIVLIIGSSALHGQSGKLPWLLASPLLVLSSCVIYGVLFMAFVQLSYESALHGARYSRGKYVTNQTLGFSSLCCFVIGYVWLILAATT